MIRNGRSSEIRYFLFAFADSPSQQLTQNPSVSKPIDHSDEVMTEPLGWGMMGYCRSLIYSVYKERKSSNKTIQILLELCMYGPPWKVSALLSQQRSGPGWGFRTSRQISAATCGWLKNCCIFACDMSSTLVLQSFNIHSEFCVSQPPLETTKP